MRASALALTVLLVSTTVLAGCLSVTDELDPSAAGAADGAHYDTSRGWSQPLSPAVYEMLPGVKTFVPSFDGVELAIGIFRPAIEGCDWEAEQLPEKCRIPTVMDAGPYYTTVVDKDKFRPPTIEWLVPRGYAVIQMSLRGTGESGGCYEFKSPTDVDDISAVIDWIAEQAWSNGNVGMIGRSYDGTSAWAGAASGNPNLKTIVPISGAVDAGYLYYKNGTSEFRGPLGGLVYWPNYAFGGDPSRIPHLLCEEVAHDTVNSPVGTVTGDASGEAWRSRDLTTPILENYKGSVWVIHGLEDWNVNPSQAVPFVNEMLDAGIDVKAWLGVWGHAYPDRVDEHRNLRWDWAEKTVQWFDKFLKGDTTVDTGPVVEVEDSLFVWRGEDAYPPRDVQWLELGLGSDLMGSSGVVASERAATFESEPLADAVRIAGLPQLHVEVTPTTATGGFLFAELYDVFPDGRSLRIGWAAINLRYHEGGNTDAETLTPGAPVVAKMEFEPVDALVAKGHTLRLVVHKDGVEDILPSPDPSPVLLGLEGDASVLRLSTVDRPTILPTYTPPSLDS